MSPESPAAWKRTPPRLYRILLWCLILAMAPIHRGPAADPTRPDEGRNELVILVHGFFRTDKDMRFLSRWLEDVEYRTLVPSLPTTFGSLEESTLELEAAFKSLGEPEYTIHFVGHSMGGLIIRHFLSRNRVPRLGRAVLIATPNQGTPLASEANYWLGPIAALFDPLDDLEPGGISMGEPLNDPGPEIGVIAGESDDWSWGNWLMDQDNDGRVPVNSVLFPGMKDFIILPFDHNEIHHHQQTARLVVRFLQTGLFQEPSP